MKRYLPLVTGALIIAAIIGSLSIGATHIDNFWSELVHPGRNEILWQIRVPRISAALIIGAALGVAGLMAQGACNNALAEPSIVGTSAGAALATVVQFCLELFKWDHLVQLLSVFLGLFLQQI